MTLLEETRALKDGLRYLETVSDNGAEVRELHQQSQILSALTAAFNVWKEYVLHLRVASVQVELPDSLIRDVVKLADDVRKKMEKKPGSQTLKSGKEWSTLQERLRTLSKSLEIAVKFAWRAHVLGRIASDPPATISSRTADTSENRQRIREYAAIYTRLQKESQTLPGDDHAIAVVEALAKSLSDAYGKVDFDVPDAVKLFLDGANSVSGAALSLLTGEVIDWLRNRQEDGLYSIRTRVK